jgi:hypothetical protein
MLSQVRAGLTDREMGLDLALHMAAQSKLVFLVWEVLDVDHDLPASGCRRRMFAGLYLRDDDLVRKVHQRMVFDRIGPPAPIEDVNAIQNLTTQVDRIDRAAAIPIVRRQLRMTADAVDDDASPQDAMAQGSNAVGSVMMPASAR